MPKVQIFPGQTYGRWTILEEVEPKRFASGTIKRMVLCKCSCGTQKVLQLYSLTNKRSTSCGCYRREQFAKMLTKHGHTKNGVISPEMEAYRGAKSRCETVSHRAYSNYGGRGIEFRFKSFQEFYDCLGPKPSKHHSIDRIDNNGHYEPGNVRWATRKQQNNNTSRNRMITFKGRTQTMRQWGEELNMKRGTLHSRINNLRWSIEKALTTPVRKISKR